MYFRIILSVMAIIIGLFIIGCSQKDSPTATPSNGTTHEFRSDNLDFDNQLPCTADQANSICYQKGYEKAIAHTCGGGGTWLWKVTCWKP